MIMSNGELILICFIFLIILIYVASYSKDVAIILTSIIALITYLLYLKKKDGFDCVNNNNGAKQEDDVFRLLGTGAEFDSDDNVVPGGDGIFYKKMKATGKEGYLDY